jgi:predicted metal-binding membrane protein
MESARIPRPISLPARIQLGLALALLVLAAIAWAVTDAQMRGMDAGPATAPGTLAFWLTAWVVMMAAMMFPSIWPMVLMFARVQSGKRRRGRAVPVGTTALFVGGYLVTWATAGVVAYALIQGGRALDPAALSWSRAGPYVAGGVIALAAVYQLTPLKDACLKRCRSPMMFLMGAWRPGRNGALRMGLEHGGWCVGCCWALMAALIALGVMSITWMVLIAALIAIEKLTPWEKPATRGIAILLVALGLAVAFVPEDVPGLTVPGSPEAMEGMDMGRGEGSSPGMDMGRGEGSSPGMDMGRGEGSSPGMDMGPGENSSPGMGAAGTEGRLRGRDDRQPAPVRR